MKKTEFYVQTENLNGRKGKVMVEHQLWGKQVFPCESILIVNDEQRLGVNINGHDVYVNKLEIVLCKMCENMCVMADKTVQITIIVNKL